MVERRAPTDDGVRRLPVFRNPSFMISSGLFGLKVEQLTSANAAMQRCLKLAALAARSDIPVLILGPTGTGKTLLAQAIHNSSTRARGPFVSFNASAMSDTWPACRAPMVGTSDSFPRPARSARHSAIVRTTFIAAQGSPVDRHRQVRSASRTCPPQDRRG